MPISKTGVRVSQFRQLNLRVPVNCDKILREHEDSESFSLVHIKMLFTGLQDVNICATK